MPIPKPVGGWWTPAPLPGGRTPFPARRRHGNVGFAMRRNSFGMYVQTPFVPHPSRGARIYTR